MKQTIQNVDLLLGIQLTEVAKYLQSHGWQTIPSLLKLIKNACQ